MMATKPLPRASDPLWVRCCRLWDQISETDHSIVIKAMEYMAEKRIIKESQDETADTPEEC